jgi:YVTN family beta-propeller protein
VATEKPITSIQGFDDPHGVAVSPNGALVYVTNADSNTVSVVEATTNTVTGTIAVGSLPWQVLFAPGGGTAYVADSDSNQVSVIDVATSSVAATIPVSDDPDALALTSDPAASELWVGENAGGAIGVIDTASNTLESTIALGTAYEPTGIVIVG